MTPKKIVVIIEFTNTAIGSMDIDAMESRIAINESQPWNASDVGIKDPNEVACVSRFFVDNFGLIFIFVFAR